MARLLTVGQLARKVGTTAKALRYYESLGLIEPALRADNNYRLYDDRAVTRLIFIRRAKLLGFTLKEIRDLLDGAPDGCLQLRREVEGLLVKKIRLCQEHIDELEELQRSLEERLLILRLEPAGIAAHLPLSPGCVCLPVDAKEVITTS